MNYKAKLSILIVAAATLLVATLHPRETHRLLTKPSRMIAAYKHDTQKNKSLAEWKERQQRAVEGDTDAMLRVGRVMLRPHLSTWTGIEPDSAKGAEFIRTAAAAGHPSALISVWRMEGSDPSDLVALSEQVLDNYTTSESGYSLEELSGWLEAYALEHCNAEIRDAFWKTSDALVRHRPENTDTYRAHQDAFKERFENRCLRV